MLGHHDRSVIEADNALDRRPGYVYGHVFKISALWMMGEHARAREASAALLQVRPNFDPATLEWLPFKDRSWNRSEEHTSELQSLMRISYAVFCLKKKRNEHKTNKTQHIQQKEKTKSKYTRLKQNDYRH